MDNKDLLQRIQELVQEEHDLRDQPRVSGSGDGDGDGEAHEDHAARLRRVEEDLDQCWDLLRQRRARADAGENPADADARPVSQVEGYRQ